MHVKFWEVFGSQIETKKVLLIARIVIGLPCYRLKTRDMDLLILLVKNCSNDPHIGVMAYIATNLQEDVLDPLDVKVSHDVHTLKKWNKIRMTMPILALVFLDIDVWSYLNGFQIDFFLS